MDSKNHLLRAAAQTYGHSNNPKTNAQGRGPRLFRKEASFRPDPGSKLEIKALLLQTVILLRGLRGKVKEIHIMKTLLGN